MEPYDPPEARSASSYNWTNTWPDNFIRVRKPKFNWKKAIYRVSWGVLVGAVLGLVYVNRYEAQVIAQQRHLIIEMYKYIVQGCPTSMMQ